MIRLRLNVTIAQPKRRTTEFVNVFYTSRIKTTIYVYV